MAASFNRLASLTLRRTCRIPSRRIPIVATCPFRPIHSTPVRRDDEDYQPPLPRQDFKFDYNDLVPEDKAEYDSLSPEEKLEYQADAAIIHAHMTSPKVESELNAEVSQLAYELSQEAPRHIQIPKPIKPGLMAMGEDDEQVSGEDQEFQGDDISSLAHGELEQHREIREMARIAAWEMPLLSSTSFFNPCPAKDS